MISRKPHKRKRFHNDWFEDDWSGAAFWCCKKEKDHCKKKKEDPCKKKKEKRSIIIHAAAAAVIGNRSHKPVLQIDFSCSPNSGCCLGFLLKLVPSNNIRCYNLI